MTKIFVASPVDVYYDEAAAARLQATNDSRYVTPRGILTIDTARWQQAQQYERATWLTYNLETTTDRNETHQDGFGGYAVLPDDLGDYVELGCGPFTNTRLIVPERSITSLTLLDPLALDYRREHPHCAYRDGTLAGHPVTVVTSAIETWQTNQHFDVVVMTNVLPHCFDAAAVFATIRRILKPGGWLVFHEAPRAIAPLDIYDVGHPLIVTAAVLDEFLGLFEPVYQQGNYFIGRKPASLASAKGKVWRK